MADPKITVLETQHDQLAGRVACLEEDVRLLRKALTRPEVLKVLGIIHVSQMEPLAPAHTASKERYRQETERQQALDDARRDALLKRLDRADRYASTTGKSMAEAWEECAKRE